MRSALRVSIALILTVLLAASAAAAAFTDDEQIVHRASVVFLHDLGLIKGYDDGSFRPANNVRRSEAAKLAAMICEENPTPSQPSAYLDVPETHWAAPYIDYCTQKGIVSGSGGYFRPDGILTGRELAKILLACVGFDGKQYTGSDWAAAVDRDAGDLGIYGGVTSDPAANVSRDNTCRMIYNAIQCLAVTGKNEKGEPIYATDALLNPITYMEYRFRIVKFSGVVTGNEFADLTKQDARLPQGQTILSGHAPFSVSTDYTALGRTAELSAVRTVVGNDVFYSVLGLPALVPTEAVFTVNAVDRYTTILRYSTLTANDRTDYYLNGNPDTSEFLLRLGDDCEITGLDRNGDNVLDAVIAYNYQRCTVASIDPLTVSAADGQHPAVALSGVTGLKKDGDCRCLYLGGTYYVVP